MAILPVTLYGDKILRQKAKPVKAIDDEVISNIRDMFQTMRNAGGIGFAANQMGLDKSIFVIDLTVMEEYADTKPMAFINPIITLESEEEVIYEEGCLSLPNLRADVERPEQIQIKYLDPDENEQVLDADDWLARVIQHEYDHLRGKMIPDRVEAEIKKRLKGQLSDIMNRKVKIDYETT